MCWSSLNPLFIKRFGQKIDALWSLKHEHIVELIGYSAATGFEAVSLVTHHMGNGNLVDYVHEEVDRNTRLELVSRVRICTARKNLIPRDSVRWVWGNRPEILRMVCNTYTIETLQSSMGD